MSSDKPSDPTPPAETSPPPSREDDMPVQAEADAPPLHGEAADVPESESAVSGEPAAADAPPPATESRTGGRAGLALALLALLGAGGAGAAAYYVWQQQEQAQQQQAQRLGALQRQLAELREAAARTEDIERLAQQQAPLQATQETLAEQQQALTDAVRRLAERQGDRQHAWLAAEADYLVRIANHRLLLERDVHTALEALRAADALMRQTGDPAAVEVRRALADSIQALRAVPQPDIAGLSLTLDSMLQALPELPLDRPSPAPVASAEPQAVPRDWRDWRDALGGLWAQLKSLVVVRQLERPTQPMLPPEQQFFLVENLRLQLEQAREALLRGEAQLYQARLQTAQDWVARHFKPESPAVQSVLATLQELQATDIRPSLPDIAAPARALDAYRRALGPGPADNAQARP